VNDLDLMFFSLPAPTLDHGTWILEPDTLELVLKRENWRRIDLEQCDTCGQILNWIFHYRTKGLTDKELADMLNALEGILRPMANHCSYFRTKTCDSSALAQAYVREARK
jgi:hypothetical protein